MHYCNISIINQSKDNSGNINQSDCKGPANVTTQFSSGYFMSCDCCFVNTSYLIEAMNFSHRCACVLCFIFGIIFSMVLNELFNSGQSFIFPPMSSTPAILKSLTNLKESVNKLYVWVIQTDHSAPMSSDAREIEESMKKLKLLCWVLTGPKNHESKAMNVKNTWGKRCDKLFFFSTEYDANLPTTVIKGAKEGRKGLWSKTRGAFKLLYEKYLGEFDFFLKADDDTYVIVENLRYLLKDYNSSVPNYFGCEFKLKSKKRNITRWNSGGAGYVLSRAAVKSMVEKGFNHANCKRSIEGGAEDINIARCLQAVNVTAVDTRDKLGRYIFNGYPASYHLTPGALPKWWSQYVKYPQKTGMDCCSDRAVTFHYITPKDMVLYEYLLYHLRPYGVH